MANGLPPADLSPAEESESPEVPQDLFEALKDRKKQGLWDGNVEHIEFKEHNLTSGKHFYILSDMKKREVECTSCPIKHGGTLDAKDLSFYQLEDGVLSFKGRAINEKA